MKKPELILGDAFKPGNSAKLFCKPTSVASLENGDFFVADGYCNGRVVKYNNNGERILEVTKREMTTWRLFWKTFLWYSGAKTHSQGPVEHWYHRPTSSPYLMLWLSFPISSFYVSLTEKTEEFNGNVVKLFDIKLALWQSVRCSFSWTNGTFYQQYHSEIVGDRLFRWESNNWNIIR